MAQPTRRNDVRVDQDGVRTIQTSGVRPSVWLAAAALVVLGLGFLLLRSTRQPMEPDLDNGGEAKAAVAAQPPPQARPPAYKPVRRSEPPEPPVPAEVPVDQPASGAVETDVDTNPEEATDDSDGEELTGIALFPRPGTDPIKRGVIVPEDFELPTGYVRHYQATDDGRRLPAILMFHPDYDWVDEDGNRIDLPSDHVVPPELAPAGMPLETLDVPEPEIPLYEEADEAGAAN